MGLCDCIWSKYFIRAKGNVILIALTTGFEEFDSKIRDLAVRENECDDLFEEVKSGKGEKSVSYLTLRDSCRAMRKELFKNARSAGLTRERIKTEIKEARKQI